MGYCFKKKKLLCIEVVITIPDYVRKKNCVLQYLEHDKVQNKKSEQISKCRYMKQTSFVPFTT